MSYADAGVQAENLNVSADYCRKVTETFSSEVSAEENSTYTKLVLEGIDDIRRKNKTIL